MPDSGVVRSVRLLALGRKWKHLARERVSDLRPNIPLGRKFWAVSEEERQAVEALFADEEVRRLVLSLNARSEGSDLEVVDTAFWMKGCSSLGKLRYGVLIELKGGGRKNDCAMVGLKEGVESAAPTAPGSEMPAHNGARVVAGARALSPNLGDRVMSADLLGRPIVLRELMPQDLKLEIDQFSRAEAIQASRYLAYVVGRAHARQLSETDRSTWRNTDAQGRVLQWSVGAERILGWTSEEMTGQTLARLLAKRPRSHPARRRLALLLSVQALFRGRPPLAPFTRAAVALAGEVAWPARRANARVIQARVPKTPATRAGT